MKILFCLLFIMIGCQDKANNGTTTIVRAEPIQMCPPGSRTGHLGFAGLISITDIEQTKVRLNWDHVVGAVSYSVFMITNSKLIHQTSINAPRSTVVIDNLEANQNYTFIVWAMDEMGNLDDNGKTLSATTLFWPNYTNQKSLALNGTQSINIGASDSFFTEQRGSISLWFKTKYKQNGSDTRLINFHRRSDSASSWISLGVKGEDIILFYHDANEQLKEFPTTFNYYDNEWHHLALTYNGSIFAVYIDSVQVKNFTDSLANIGTQHAHIGSYTGMQKGFRGNIDEVSIWKAALGAHDMESIYNNGVSTNLKQHQRASTLKSWYRLGDDLQDGITHMQDQAGSMHGTPNGIRQQDIILDGP